MRSAILFVLITACASSEAPQVRAGGFHACALDAAGTVHCWGLNDRGQVAPPGSDCPLGMSAMCGDSTSNEAFTEIAAGSRHSCGVTQDGEVLCWGQNLEDELIAPGGSCLTAPEEGVCTEARAPLAVHALTAGGYHTCGISETGAAVCWGRTWWDAQLPPEGTQCERIDAGFYHTCCTEPGSGALQCWGDNEHGQSTPPAGSYSQVSAGFYHSCAIDTDGQLACWGDDRQGQSSPPGGTYIAVTTGVNHGCAINTYGQMVCWGSGADASDCSFNGGWHCGQSAPPDGEYVQVDAGDLYTCAVQKDGRVVCFGLGETGTRCPDGDCGQALPPTSIQPS